MDTMLCDELLQEIFTRLPTSSPTSSISVSLVSKRWLYLYRSSKTSLCLRLTPNNSIVPSLSSFLSHYPSLSTLSLLLSSTADPSITTASFSDQLLCVVSSSCSNLKHLKFTSLPVSASALLSLSKTCNHITSLTVSVSRHLLFNWVAHFPSLKELSVSVCCFGGVDDESCINRESGLCLSEEPDAELGLESICLSGIGRDDWGVGWLWRSCKKLKKLKLKSCEGVGDGGSFLSFIRCLQGLEEVELRTCRSIVDGVLLKLAENCYALQSLLVYDGGSTDALLHFICNCRCKLLKLDLRLPLDLSNDHLSALAVNFRSLSTLSLQSCCLVTGDGLKTLGIAMSSSIEELALINCDVIDRESGLLATLGQHFRYLRKLDLSYNEMLADKELISMIVSCNYLIELKLRGCKRLTNMATVSVFKSCKKLESVDIMYCCGIEVEAVELFILNSPQLRRVQVEESKLSDVAKTWASRKFIEVVT